MSALLSDRPAAPAAPAAPRRRRRVPVRLVVAGAAVAEPAGGAATPAKCTTVDEAARWGGTALLTCARAGTTAASVLVVRTEAGWRLREVVTSGGEG